MNTRENGNFKLVVLIVLIVLIGYLMGINHELVSKIVFSLVGL
jgi:hypothetical protein